MSNTKENMRFFQLVIDKDLMGLFNVKVKTEEYQTKRKLNMTSKITELIEAYVAE